jgi:hypothetical protein
VVDGKILLRKMFKLWDVGYGLHRAGSVQRQMAGICEWGNESSG